MTILSKIGNLCFRPSMVALAGFNPLTHQAHIVSMMCLPRAADLDRTVIEAIPVKQSSGWWTGLVRDRDHETGETRLRLERLVENQRGVDIPHVWRVRPDFWESERDAVNMLMNGGGSAAPSSLPISDRYTPHEYIPIRKDDVRHVAVVRLQKPSGWCTRLYHWDARDGSVRQKFTTGQPWDDLVSTANTRLR